MPPTRHPGSCVIASLLIACLFSAAWGQTAPEPLTTAIELRSLDSDIAEEGQPADITGVVIFSDAPGTIFLQDETAGAFFRPGKQTPPQPGDLVRVRGITQAGLYIPGIEDSKFEILGQPGMPEPIPANYDDLMSGRFHYQRVLIEGVVRTVNEEAEGTSVVRISLGSRVVEIYVEEPPPDEAEARWVDSRVAVSGLAAGHINARRQLVAPYLRCSGWPEFRVLSPPPKTNQVPSVSPQELLNYEVDGQGGHRVRVSGVVLATFPRGELFLRDEESAISVKLLPKPPLPKIGQTVEVLGFPEMERFSASVVDAEVTQVDPTNDAPKPLPVTLGELMSGDEDGNLVSVTGALTDWYRNESGGVLLLQEDKRSIQVYTPALSEAPAAGAQLQVTGICQVETTKSAQYRSTPESVILRMRSADDLKILRAPGWWTPRRLGSALVVLLIIVTLAGLWITLLRRQVSRQTVALRHRIEHEAALEERQRIAREFHDTLEQELAGLSLRLDAATARGKDEKLKALLTGSRNLVARIQTETRNLVADLRDTSGEFAELEPALRELVSRQSRETGPKITCELEDDESLPPLPSRTVHHLKMIAQEAITNALKHAEAQHIELRVTHEANELILTVSDDGRGFDVEQETRGKPGHFGCMGIRERSTKVGAQVSWRKNDAQGTTLEVRLPLPESETSPATS